ncbi:MAG: acyltransferase family protein [Lachnospiraceae bacterium]
MKSMTGNVKVNAEFTKLNRDISLDAVKGFAILLVMLGHCIVLNGLADPYLYDAIAAVQMPLFMAVSGYLAGQKHGEPGQKPDLKRSAKTFGKRSVAYLVPFFTWMIIVSFPHCLKELKTELFHLDYGLWFLATLWIITFVHMLAAYIADYSAYAISKNGAVDSQYTVGSETDIMHGVMDSQYTIENKSETIGSQDEMEKSDYHGPYAVGCKVKTMRFLVYCLAIFICYAGFFLQARSGNTFLSPSLTVRYLPFYVVTYLVAYDVLPYLQKRKTHESNDKTVDETDDEIVTEHEHYVTENIEKNEIKSIDNNYIIGNILCIVCALIFIYLVCAYDMVVVTDTTSLIIQMLASFLGVFSCFYGVAHFCKGWLQRALAYIGQYTLEIYVLHFRFARILGLSEKNLTPFHVDTILWILASFVLMSILTAVFISALKQLWITDLLCFGKIRPRKRKQTSREAEIP